jgi:hypothetical protein
MILVFIILIIILALFALAIWAVIGAVAVTLGFAFSLLPWLVVGALAFGAIYLAVVRPFSSTNQRAVSARKARELAAAFDSTNAQGGVSFDPPLPDRRRALDHLRAQQQVRWLGRLAGVTIILLLIGWSALRLWQLRQAAVDFVPDSENGVLSIGRSAGLFAAGPVSLLVFLLLGVVVYLPLFTRTAVLRDGEQIAQSGGQFTAIVMGLIAGAFALSTMLVRPTGVDPFWTDERWGYWFLDSGEVYWYLGLAAASVLLLVVFGVSELFNFRYVPYRFDHLHYYTGQPASTAGRVTASVDHRNATIATARHLDRLLDEFPALRVWHSVEVNGDVFDHLLVLPGGGIVAVQSHTWPGGDYRYERVAGNWVGLDARDQAPVFASDALHGITGLYERHRNLLQGACAVVHGKGRGEATVEIHNGRFRDVAVLSAQEVEAEVRRLIDASGRPTIVNRHDVQRAWWALGHRISLA